MSSPLQLPKIILAPMAGYTDPPFRRICRELGAEWGITELISADGISTLFPRFKRWVKDNKMTLLEAGQKLNTSVANEEKVKGLKLFATAKIEESERPISIQVFGKHPETIANAISALIQIYRPDGIDINMGCPAKDVFRHGSGCALLAEPKKVIAIIEAACEAVNKSATPDIPLSVKTRLGIENEDELKPLVKPMFKAGLDMLIVHARIYRDFFSGKPRLAALRKVVEEVRKVDGYVIGNGGVVDLKTAKEMMKTGVDGLAVGRGAVGNPWIFKTIKDEKEYIPSMKDRVSAVQRHATLAWKYAGSQGILEMRKHLGAYFRGVKGAKRLRTKLVTVETLSDVKAVLKTIIE